MVANTHTEAVDIPGMPRLEPPVLLALDLGQKTGWAVRTADGARVGGAAAGDDAAAGNAASASLGQPPSRIEWRTVPGWPEYEVSGDGRVRRVAGGRGARSGRVLKPSRNRRTGYLSVMLSREGRRRRVDVHRLVASAFLGPRPSERHLVAHGDGSRTNNHWLNLRWATQRDNLADCHAHGTARVGAASPHARLDAIDVGAICRMKQLGVPRRLIAEGFGLHKRTVFAILAGTSWRSVA